MYVYSNENGFFLKKIGREREREREVLYWYNDLFLKTLKNGGWADRRHAMEI
jgi:hypothetical protein